MSTAHPELLIQVLVIFVPPSLPPAPAPPSPGQAAVEEVH